MERTPEPELMEEAGQALAYARADFSAPHARFVELFAERFPGLSPQGAVLDLGCGPADITIRFALAHTQAVLHGVDGSLPMLAHGQEAVERAGLQGRVALMHGYLPGAHLSRDDYQVIISNSLLHHLRDPSALWQTVMRHGAPGAALFVMDLLRPADLPTVAALVERYAAGEPEVLRHDFHASLLAAYRPDEVRDQLATAGLDTLAVEVVSDRHLIVAGRLPT